MTATLAVLRFPRTPAQSRGRDVVTDPDGRVVLTTDTTHRGRQVDVAAPDGAPLGRILDAGRAGWQLIAPGTGAVLAGADLRHGVRVWIGAGPAATVKGHGEEWDLLWERTTLLAARKVPRKVAKRCLDVWVTEPACTPPVVTFVVHVRRWWAAAEAANEAALQQLQQPVAVPDPSY